MYFVHAGQRLASGRTSRHATRMVQLLIEDPLMVELVGFVPGSNAAPDKQVHLRMRTTADVVAACVVPLQCNAGQVRDRLISSHSQPREDVLTKLCKRAQEVCKSSFYLACEVIEIMRRCEE
jgi:hypothetical protein